MDSSMSKRVLLFYITPNSGHYYATLAISNALKSLDKGLEIKSVDALNYTSPITGRLVNRSYIKVIKSFPYIWKWLYDNPKVFAKTDRLKNFINNKNAQKIKQLLAKFKPDVVVCTQAYPCGIVAEYKRLFNSKIPLIAVLTDHAPHSYWFYEGVNYYVIPSPDTKDVLIKRGIPRERIKEFGIPVDLKFSALPKKTRIIQEFKIAPGCRTLLIMGGSQGIGPIETVVGKLGSLNLPLNIIVVTGSNYRLYRKLKQRRYKNNVLVFGRSDKIDRLMDAADLLITKPGGITTSEALCKSLPMIIVRPIPGQESFNTEFLLRCGAAVMAVDCRSVSREAARLLSSPKIVNAMVNSARRIARPQAALDIARLVLSLANN
jgi:processive 1,2-diacylglycerol beta-glucosyltransferase